MAEEQIKQTSEAPLGAQPNVGKPELSLEDRKAKQQALQDEAVGALESVVKYIDGKRKGLSADIHPGLNAVRGQLDHYLSRLTYDLSQLKGE